MAKFRCKRTYPRISHNFNWLHSKTIAREMSYRQRKIRQTQGIKKAKLTFELG